MVLVEKTNRRPSEMLFSRLNWQNKAFLRRLQGRLFLHVIVHVKLFVSLRLQSVECDRQTSMREAIGRRYTKQNPMDPQILTTIAIANTVVLFDKLVNSHDLRCADCTQWNSCQTGEKTPYLS